jgi:hypothetical protein
MATVVAANAQTRHSERTRAAAEVRRGGAVEPAFAFATPLPASEACLSFDSSFESMNLLRAVRVGATEYNLTMAPDTRTHGHTQWYFFRVRGGRPGVHYRLNIINMQKIHSLYESGLRPLLYSQKLAAHEGVGWRRTGTDVCYYANFYPRPVRAGRPARTYHTLTLTVSFPHADDSCFLAHCYPYTYTDLQRDLRALTDDPRRGKLVCRQTLCTTLAGNRCDVLTITNYPPSGRTEAGCVPAFERTGSSHRKRAVVLSARVHPGETNASHIMCGMLLALTADNERAAALRNEFVFVVVPMLNPDGVVNGNYRCSLSGCDLNRLWQAPPKHVAPCVYALKALIGELSQNTELSLFCDIHGHSRKQNAFLYGCNCDGDPARRLQERMFPHLLSRACAPFSFDDCSFKMQQAKRSTARIVCRSEFNLLNSFTLEVSLAGTNLSVEQPYHFNVADYHALGANFVDALHTYAFLSPAALHEHVQEIEAVVQNQMAGAALRRDGGESGCNESDGADSDSGGSDDDPMEGEHARSGEAKRVGG